MADIRDKSGTGKGPWLVRWREGGKQKYRQFATQEDAEAFKTDREKDRAAEELDKQTRRSFERGELTAAQAAFLGLEKEIAPDSEWSVVEYASRMIEADDLRPASRHTYLRALRRYFEDTDLGRADVRYVSPEQITKWWSTLENGRADAHRLLSKTLKRAITVGDRADNPLSRAPEVKKPRRVREEDFDPLTADQIEELADAATRATKGFPGELGEMTRQRDRLLILTMGFTGLRAGEAGGVRLQDLVKTSDGKCQLRVRQQVVRAGGVGEQPRVAPLKTSASKRTITIACSVWEELKAFVDRYGPADDGRVFRGPNGEMRDGVLIRNMVYAAGKRLGMKVNPHLLRHSAVSLLIHEGANPRAIQAFVGHADIGMTLGTYGHLFDKAGTELANIMERLREQHRNGK